MVKVFFIKEDIMGILSGCEPKEALEFFEELCAIPHGSGNTKAISDYCVKFANDRGLTVIQDEINNIIITKEATKGYENKDTIILQGHLDMVCVKTPESDFDFQTDGLMLEYDGQWLSAKNTSLGGDDGIAIAMILAILNSSTIQHPPIEAIFTIDEEIGLVGAQAIDLAMLKGKKLINIDSEDDTQILTSCAGGLSINTNIPISYHKTSGLLYEIKIHGLLGGHSGAEIHKQRGNANVLMGRVLNSLGDKIQLINIYGGTAHNVIPRLSSAEILINADYEDVFLTSLAQIESEIQDEYAIADSGFQISTTRSNEVERQVLDSIGTLSVINALINLPNGIQTMSTSIEGLVETSANLAVCHMSDHSFHIEFSLRSSKETAKHYLADRIISMIRFMGGNSEIIGEYPAWEYKEESQLRESVVKVYTKIFDKEPIVAAIHAGLECGLFSKKIPGIDCISIGPNLEDIHSVNERMEIASVEKIWKLLIGVLEMKEDKTK